jgi:hypothetical protein
MSATSEEVPATDPLDAPYPAARRTSERPEPRLAAISDAPSFPRSPRLEASRLEATRLDTSRLDALRPAASPGDRLETAMSEFVRRQIRPEAVPVPAEFKREGKRSIWVAGAVGVAGAVAISSVAALLFVTLFPREKDAIQSFAAAIPAATSQARQADDAAKAPVPQSRPLLAENDRGESLTHEQSERLLQQFVQWQQKTALSAKP